MIQLLLDPVGGDSTVRVTWVPDEEDQQLLLTKGGSDPHLAVVVAYQHTNGRWGIASRQECRAIDGVVYLQFHRPGPTRVLVCPLDGDRSPYMLKNADLADDGTTLRYPGSGFVGETFWREFEVPPTSFATRRWYQPWVEGVMGERAKDECHLRGMLLWVILFTIIYLLFAVLYYLLLVPMWILLLLLGFLKTEWVKTLKKPLVLWSKEGVYLRGPNYWRKLLQWMGLVPPEVDEWQRREELKAENRARLEAALDELRKGEQGQRPRGVRVYIAFWKTKGRVCRPFAELN